MAWVYFLPNNLEVTISFTYICANQNQLAMLKEMKKRDSLSVSEILGMLDRGELNFNPSYQREANIWSVAKKKLFVFTVMNSSKYLTQDITVNARPPKVPYGPEILDVVDGKQRLTTIIEFVTGKQLRGNEWVKTTSRLKIGGEETYWDQLLTDTPEMRQYMGKTFNKLPDSVQQYILDVKLDMVKLYEYKNKTVVNIFSLLQIQSQLTPGERLSSSDTILNTRAKAIEADYKTTLDIISTNKRAAHTQTIIQLLALGVDQGCNLQLFAVQNLFSKTKDSKKIKDTVFNVRDFLSYIADVVALFKDGEKPTQYFGRMYLNAMFVAWVKSGGFTVSPEDFKEMLPTAMTRFAQVQAIGGNKSARAKRVAVINELVGAVTA